VIPHPLVLAVLLLAWILVALHPPLAWRFGGDVMHGSLRVQTYLLLVHDAFFKPAATEGPAR
jgi:hypothetical protein